MNRWVTRVSSIAIVLNLAFLAFHYYSFHEIANRTALPTGRVIRPITSLDAKGRPEIESTAVTWRCHVVRYTSIHCPWCRKDEPSWSSFEQGLLSHGCDSAILAPSASDLPQSSSPVSGRRMLPLVPAYIAQDLNLAATPTTIVLDDSWRVTWSVVGVLQAGDMEKALSSLPERKR